MVSVKVLLLAVVACLSSAASGHTTFTNFFVDGIDQGDAVCTRMSNFIQNATDPIRPPTSNDMACGVHGEVGVSRVCSANAGSIVTFEFRTWPDASHPGSIDISHKGPCAVYMKKVDDASASNNAAGDGWFKIFQEDYDSSASKWCTEKLIDNDGHLSVSVPNDLQGGYYLVRPELLALQQADKTPADPQFYTGCAQVFLKSTGSAVPQDTVSIPGYIDMTKNAAAMIFNIYDQPMKLPYPMFGPPVYTASSSKRDVAIRDTTSQETQTIGLKPQGCVLEIGNWCGIELPSYSGEAACWNASSACWKQDTACYSSAGPTGGGDCSIWETKCDGIKNACNAGNFNGPPNTGKDLTPTQKSISLPPPVNSEGSGTSPPNSASTSQPSSAASAMPSASSESVPASTSSIDQCGSNGGATCAAGMCCSQHGFCGIGDDYCGGCQTGFGDNCTSVSTPMLARRHVREFPQV